MRALIYGLPIGLILLALAAFSSVHKTRLPFRNTMSIGSATEPKTLNPIQAADASGSQVMGLIFDGLMALDEDLNFTGRLAESLNLTQVSTLFFLNSTRAAEAVAKLKKLSDRWKS